MGDSVAIFRGSGDGRVFGDRRTRHVATLLTLLCCLSLIDLCFTLWAHRFTPFFEVNPMARGLLAHRNVGGLIAMKVALTSLGGLIFWSLRRRGSVEAALWMLVIVHMLLMVRWSSYVSTIDALSDQDRQPMQVAGL